MKILFILNIIVLCNITIVFADVGKKISEYFSGDTFKTIQSQWQIQRKSFENALSLILEQNYGHRGMNVYVRKLADSFKFSKGFFFCDNIVDVILSDLYLQELPNVISPDVTFALASNFLHVEAKLTKMIIRTQYFLNRNQNEIVFKHNEQDPLRNSPFSFQQVQHLGELTIVADDCSLEGYTITTLKAQSVNLGLDTFKVINCKFTIEIYSKGFGSPPVIAPYFSKKQGKAIERMLAKPIRAEIMPKLQAAVFSYVNTSSIFGQQLPKLRLRQKNIFKETANFMDIIVKKVIQSSIKYDQCSIQLKPLEFTRDKRCTDETCRLIITLVDPILYGLDTAYSSHSGGPYRIHSNKIVEEIRFSTMLVRGKIHFNNSTLKGEHVFAVELRDVAVNVEMDVKSSSYSLTLTKIEFMGWRAIEFSMVNVDIFANARKISQSFINGHLINEIPRKLLNHLSNILGDVKNLQEFNSDITLANQNSEQSDEINDKDIENVKEAGYNKIIDSNEETEKVTEVDVLTLDGSSDDGRKRT